MPHGASFPQKAACPQGQERLKVVLEYKFAHGPREPAQRPPGPCCRRVPRARTPQDAGPALPSGKLAFTSTLGLLMRFSCAQRGHHLKKKCVETTEQRVQLACANPEKQFEALEGKSFAFGSAKRTRPRGPGTRRSRQAQPGPGGPPPLATVWGTRGPLCGRGISSFSLRTPRLENKGISDWKIYCRNKAKAES